jgi:3-oxoadipate enol-lactonase
MQEEPMHVVANGVRTRCEVSGSSGPWVVLSHSLACDRSMWDEQVRLLEGRYRVARYDTRGHGGSDTPPSPYTLDDLAADAIGVMDALSIDRAHFVGLSMGGMVAQAAALAHPARFRSLVLADTTSRYPPEFGPIWESRIALAREGGMEAHVAPTLARWFTLGFPQQERSRATLARIAGWIRATRVEGYVGCSQALRAIHTWPRLGEIRCPVLVIVGEQDPTTPLAMARDIHEAIRGSELVVIPDAAHISNIEQPAAFDAALARFLDAQPR